MTVNNSQGRCLDGDKLDENLVFVQDLRFSQPGKPQQAALNLLK